jgi:ATP-dependent helicase YprA (DUF1998 family)
MCTGAAAASSGKIEAGISKQELRTGMDVGSGDGTQSYGISP